MQNISLQKMGGTGALLVALCTGLFGLLVLLAPSTAVDAGLSSWPHVLADYALALAGLFGLAALPAISDRVAHVSEGWMRWTSSLAGLGFAVLAVVNFWQADYERTMTVESLGLFALDQPQPSPGASAEPAYALAWHQLLTRAPQGWLEAAGIGLWIFTVSWLARGGLLPGGTIRLGLVAGVLSILTAVGATLDAPFLKLSGLVAGGLVLTPLWFAWTGLILLQVDPSPIASTAGDHAADPARRRKKRDRSALLPFSARNPTFRRIWELYGDGS